MKKIILTTFIIFYTSLFAGSTVGINMYGGYGWNLSQEVNGYKTVNRYPSAPASSTDTTQVSKESISSSRGPIAPFGIDLHINVQPVPRLSVFVGSGWAPGAYNKNGYLVSQTINTTTNGAIISGSETSQSYSYIPVKLGVGYIFGNKSVKPYLDGALIVALGGGANSITTTTYSETYHDYFQTELSKNVTEYQVNYWPSLGFQIGAGIALSIHENVSLNLGAQITMLSMIRKNKIKTQNINYYINSPSKDMIDNRENKVDIHTEYSKNVDNNYDLDSAVDYSGQSRQAIYIKDQFHTIVLKLGIQINI